MIQTSIIGIKSTEISAKNAQKDCEKNCSEKCK